MRKLARLGLFVAISLGVARGAAAEPRDPVKADALFRQGQALLAKGDYALACLRLADSYALDPTLGTLLNLAFCHEKEQRLFTAWTEYKRAEAEATRTEQRERASFARDRAAELAQKLPRARIAGALAKTVILDGQRIDASSGEAFVVPSGEHVIEIETDAGERRKATATFPADPGVVTTVRFADEAPKVAAPAAGLASTSSTSTAAPTSNDAGAGDPGALRRTIGFGASAVGLVAMAGGVYFGIATFDQKAEAAKSCDATGCDRAGKEAGDLAHTYATLSTVLVLVGAAATAAGATLVLTAPSRSSASSRPGFSAELSPVGLSGAF